MRRGEYEGLAARLGTPEGAPDAGPAVFNARSGASIVGVRFPLIAFNVNLATDDLGIAKRIAEAVRFSGGGYRYVRAMGVALEDKGQVQVSMRHRRSTRRRRSTGCSRPSSPRRRATAWRWPSCELIGLAPLAAFEDVIRHYLQLPDFSAEAGHREPLLETQWLQTVHADGRPARGAAARPASFAPGIRRAPDRGYTLLARGRPFWPCKNALRYVPPALHEAVAPEFLAELRERGRIYGYRFRPQPGRGPTPTATSRRGPSTSTGASWRPGRCSSTSTTTWTSPSPSIRTSW